MIKTKARGTKYPQVKVLPEGAQLASRYAKDNDYSSVQYLYTKYDRAGTGNFAGVDFKIVAFQGFNFVIPKKK